MLNLIATCVNATAEEVESYNQTEREITLEEFRKYINLEDYYALAKSFGYVLNPKYGVAMHKDWHLHYGKGVFKGKIVLCVYHSEIHHFYEFSKRQGI